MAFSSANILLMPSNVRLKLLPICGSHTALKNNWLWSVEKTDIIANARVANEAMSDHPLAPFSLLIKIVAMPASNGISIKKSAIISVISSFPD